jgi:hypothetical protein
MFAYYFDVEYCHSDEDGGSEIGSKASTTYCCSAFDCHYSSGWFDDLRTVWALRLKNLANIILILHLTQIAHSVEFHPHLLAPQCSYIHPQNSLTHHSHKLPDWAILMFSVEHLTESMLLFCSNRCTCC